MKILLDYPAQPSILHEKPRSGVCADAHKRKHMFTRLEPPIPMNTVKGDGYAFAVIDYGFEADLIWVIVLDETREIWCIPNAEVRFQKNWTAGRRD